MTTFSTIEVVFLMVLFLAAGVAVATTGVEVANGIIEEAGRIEEWIL